MPKHFFKILVFSSCLVSGSKGLSQTAQTAIDINNLLKDAVWYSDLYITPATDAAVYQASSAWIATPQKRKRWDFRINLNTNLFFVPKANRKFTITNSDFSFFKIENGTSATVPTTLGNDNQIYLVGSIDDGTNQNEVRLKTPEGLNMETVVYPYLQASLELPKGFELIAKYSGSVQLKKGYYQVYGAGLKYNVSQFLPKMEAHQFYLSAFAGFSKEEISFDFLNAQTQIYGSLGLNQIIGFVNTYQFQMNASKKWKHFELMAGSITNVSDIKYEVGGDAGAISLLFPIQAIVNNRLSEIYKKKTNSIGEISGRYQFGKFYTQATVAFGKFANTNISLQYEL